MNYMRKFNADFQTNVQIEDRDIIDIYKKQLYVPMECCRYCVEKPQYFSWEVSGNQAKISDYCVDSKSSNRNEQFYDKRE